MYSMYLHNTRFCVNIASAKKYHGFQAHGFSKAPFYFRKILEKDKTNYHRHVSQASFFAFVA